MTAGKKICSDCGRNSTTDRHASCHILAILRMPIHPSGHQTKMGLMAEVYPVRHAVWPLDTAPVDGVIKTLRRQGHKVLVINNRVILREG